MQSFNQIARSGDERSGKNKTENKLNGTLNLWLTESCEGTLKSPKSFKLGHMALAFVTLMLRNNADAVELEVREEISQKTGLLTAVDYCCGQTISQSVSEKWHQYYSQGLGVINKKDFCNPNTSGDTETKRG